MGSNLLLYCYNTSVFVANGPKGTLLLVKAEPVYCIVCGSKNPEYAVFCFNCGSKMVRPLLESAPEPPTPEPVSVASAPELAPLAATEPAAVLPTSPIAGSQNQVFSISARDLADFNPFLFSDNENAAAPAASLPVEPAANLGGEAQSALVASRTESPPPVETTAPPISASYTQTSNSSPYASPPSTSPAPIPYAQPTTPAVNPMPPALSHPTANPYAEQPALNHYPNVPPTAPAPPPYATNNPYPVGQPAPPPSPYNPYGGMQSSFVPAPPPRPLLAPNGLPYVVVDQPKSFYDYKTKTGQRVYAAYSEVWQRLLAAAVDTVVILAPFFLILFIYLLAIGPDLQKWLDASNAGDISATEKYLPHWTTLLLYLVYLAYTTLLTADGQTLGKRIFRLKVITLAGTRPDLRTSFMRNLFGFAFVLGGYIAYYQNPFTGVLGQVLETIVGIGFALILFDPRRQGWHDKLAGTLVVKSKELVEGVDFPAKGQL